MPYFMSGGAPPFETHLSNIKSIMDPAAEIASYWPGAIIDPREDGATIMFMLGAELLATFGIIDQDRIYVNSRMNGVHRNLSTQDAIDVARTFRLQSATVPADTPSVDWHGFKVVQMRIQIGNKSVLVTCCNEFMLLDDRCYIPGDKTPFDVAYEFEPCMLLLM
jgi:hypothetical protein